MPSSPRYSLIYDHCTFHITWQCHNKNWLLEAPGAKALYINLLKKYAKQYQIEIYNFCLMSNHPHITGCCNNARLLSDYLRIVNSLFARKFNQRHGRKGQVVMDRFKSPVIETDNDLLKVMLYIDMNPVRAKMVKHPKKYHWSSHNFYATGKFPAWITPAPTYIKLGKTYSQRARAYRKFIEDLLATPFQKQTYSTVYFIGSKNWVYSKAKKMREENAERREKWLFLYKIKFGKPPPGSQNKSETNY